MRLGLLLRYKGDGGLRMDLVHEAERLGFEFGLVERSLRQ